MHAKGPVCKQSECILPPGDPEAVELRHRYAQHITEPSSGLALVSTARDSTQLHGRAKLES